MSPIERFYNIDFKMFSFSGVHRAKQFCYVIVNVRTNDVLSLNKAPQRVTTPFIRNVYPCSLITAEFRRLNGFNEGFPY